jgi:hypothetical protein
MSAKNKEQVLLESIKKQNPLKLEESKLSLMGKIFFGSAAAYIAGDLISTLSGKSNTFKSPIKIRGTEKQLQAIADAIISTKEFQREISKPGANVNNVMKKLNLANIDKQRFEKLTGKKWPIS